MTEIPALRDALVEAAARRARRPRAPRAGLALAPLAAVAAVVAVIFVLAGRPAPDPERPAATPAPTAGFAVLQRPKTPADAVPGHPSWDSRLVAHAHGVRLWLAPRGGEVCAVARRDATERTSCAATAPGGSGWGMVWRILPDDAIDARITSLGGDQVAPPVRDNALLVAKPRLYASIGWTRGRTRYVRQEATLYGPRPGSCPRLDALPADWRAGAARIALRSVDLAYNGLVRATVTSIARATGTPCPGGDPARSVLVSLHLVTASRAARSSASLSEGRLLLGMVRGRMTVYQLMH